MKALWIDTSTHVLFVCITVDDKIVYELKQPGNNNHSETLLDAIHLGMKQTSLEVKDMDRIVVGIGPGSYTGLRVGLTVAKMFSWTHHIPLLTISSLDMVASGYYTKNGIYPIMMKAKKGFVYAKIIEVKDDDIITHTQEQFTSIDAFVNLFLQYDVTSIIQEETFAIHVLAIKDCLLTEVNDVGMIEPNYLRGAM